MSEASLHLKKGAESSQEAGDSRKDQVVVWCLEGTRLGWECVLRSG